MKFGLPPTLQVYGPCRVSCNKPSIIAKTLKQHLKPKPSQATTHIIHKAAQPTQMPCFDDEPGREVLEPGSELLHEPGSEDSEDGAATKMPPSCLLQHKPSSSPHVNQASKPSSPHANQASKPQPPQKPAPKSMPVGKPRRTFSSDNRGPKLARMLSTACSKGRSAPSSSSVPDSPVVQGGDRQQQQQSESSGPADDSEPEIHLYAFGSWHAGGAAVRTSY